MKDLKQKPVDNSVGSETILWYNKGWNDSVKVYQQHINELKSLVEDAQGILITNMMDEGYEEWMRQSKEALRQCDE